MVLELDLSEKTLREKFYGIANEVGSPRLAEATQNASLDSIISRIIRENKAKPIVEKFLADFPEGDYIAKSILQFKGSALKAVMESFGSTASYADRLEDMKKAAEALNQDGVLRLANKYKGKALGSVMSIIIDEGYYKTNMKSVKKAIKALNQSEVIKLAKDYKGKALGTVMGAVRLTIYNTEERGIVRKVVGLARNYKGVPLEIVMVTVMNTLDELYDKKIMGKLDKLEEKRTMEKVIEALNQDEVIKLTSSYKGKVLEDVIESVGYIIEQTYDGEAIGKIAEMLNQPTTIKLARSYKYRTVWETMVDEVVEVACTPRDKAVKKVLDGYLTIYS